jgi:hypothetical protein
MSKGNNVSLNEEVYNKAEENIMNSMKIKDSIV